MYRPAIISVPQKQTTLPSRIIGRRDPPMRWQNHDLGAGPPGFRAHAGPIPEAFHLDALGMRRNLDPGADFDARGQGFLKDLVLSEAAVYQSRRQRPGMPRSGRRHCVHLHSGRPRIRQGCEYHGIWQGRARPPAQGREYAATPERFRPSYSFASGGSFRRDLPGPLRPSSGDVMLIPDQPDPGLRQNPRDKGVALTDSFDELLP